MNDPFVFVSQKVSESIKQLKQDISYESKKDINYIIDLLNEDIDELYETIEVVENEPNKWNISKQEIQKRKQFLMNMQNELKDIHNQFNIKNKIASQNEKLDDIHKSLLNVNSLAFNISQEIKDQDEIMIDIEENIDVDEKQMKRSIVKLDKLIENLGNNNLMCIIIILVVLLVIIITLIFVL